MTKRKSEFVGPPQPDMKLDEVRLAEGRTIEWIDFGMEKRRRRVHGGEGMLIHFTDGSQLKITIGSNAFNIGIDPETLNTDIMVFFDEPKRKRTAGATRTRA